MNPSSTKRMNHASKAALRLLDALEILVANREGNPWDSCVVLPVSMVSDHAEQVSNLNALAAELAMHTNRRPIHFHESIRNLSEEFLAKRYEVLVHLPEPPLEYINELREAIEKNGVQRGYSTSFIKFGAIKRDPATTIKKQLDDILKDMDRKMPEADPELIYEPAAPESIYHHYPIQKEGNQEKVDIPMPRHDAHSARGMANALKLLAGKHFAAINDVRIKFTHTGTVSIVSPCLRETLQQMSDVLAEREPRMNYAHALHHHHPAAINAINAAFSEEIAEARSV